MKAKSVIFHFLFGVTLAVVLGFIMTMAASIDPSMAGTSRWEGLTVGYFVVLLEIGALVILFTSRKSLWQRPIDWKPIKSKAIFMASGLVAGFILNTSVVWARSIDLTKAGVAFWVFVGIGLVIILLQAIPAIIVAIIFIGHTTKIIHDKIPVKEETFSESREYAREKINK
jgi:hypothetical protein